MHPSYCGIRISHVQIKRGLQVIKDKPNNRTYSSQGRSYEESIS